MVEFISDMQIKEMPKCHICNNANGFILAYGGFTCGDCCMKIDAEKKRREAKVITEIIEDIKNA